MEKLKLISAFWKKLKRAKRFAVFLKFVFVRVDLNRKMSAFVFDYKLNWKAFEKYLKQKEGVVGDAQKRESIIKYIRRVLNDNKFKFITKQNVNEVIGNLKEITQNDFEKKSVEYFERFLNFILIK